MEIFLFFMYPTLCPGKSEDIHDSKRFLCCFTKMIKYCSLCTSWVDPVLSSVLERMSWALALWVQETTDGSKSLQQKPLVQHLSCKIGMSVFLVTAPPWWPAIWTKFCKYILLLSATPLLQHPPLPPFFSTNTVLKPSENRCAHTRSNTHVGIILQ